MLVSQINLLGSEFRAFFVASEEVSAAALAAHSKTGIDRLLATATMRFIPWLLAREVALFNNNKSKPDLL